MMSPYQTTHQKTCICLLVLAHLFAILLPVHRATAAGHEDNCGKRVTLAASAPAMTVASADEEVIIPAEKVDLAVFSATWRDRLNDAREIESLIVSLFIVHADKFTNVDVGDVLVRYREEYEADIETLEKLFPNQGDYDLLIHHMLNIALETPEIAGAVPFVWKDLATREIQEESVTFDLWVGSSARSYSLSDNLLHVSPNILNRVYACAREIPEVAEAFDRYHDKLLGVGIGDSASTVMAKNPDLSVPPIIRDNISDDGTVAITLNDLKELTQAEFEKIHTSIDEMRETLSEIDQKQDVIIDYLKDQELKAKWQAVMQKKAAEQQLKLDAAKASLSIATILIGQIDPKMAKQVSVIGASTLQVGMALNGWLKAVSGLKGLDKIASLSTVVMTGNVLGAVMNVVSLFGDAKPTPEQMILEEIGRLRQQVDQLRLEMHDRFDRIDVGLNAIYTSMHERFNQIDVQLGRIDGNIQELQRSLLDLDLKLSRIERNNFEFLNALGRRPLLEAINGGLGYQARTGLPMPYQPEFVHYENVLHSWATIHAFDPVNAGPTQRDYGDAQVMAELNAYPLDANLNYLNGWLTVHGLPPIANKRLPSPRDWLFASRAYAQLAVEWPEHMRRIDPKRQAALDEIGQTLEAALGNLSTLTTLTDAQGNGLLFTKVITNHQDKLERLTGGIQALETAFVDEIRANRLQRNDPFDLYGGVDQTLVYLAEGLSRLSHDEAGDPLPLPGNVAALIANLKRYHLAEYLRIEPTPQTRTSLVGIVTNRRPVPGCTPSHTKGCAVLGDLRIAVGVYYGNVLIARMDYLAGLVTLPVVNGDVEGATAYVVRNWGSLRPRFEAGASEVAPTPEIAEQRALLADAVALKVEERLAGYQRELYAQVLNELTQGSLQALANEAAGSKAILEGLVALGLPRAVAADEFLHAMLYGDQQLVDDKQIVQSYALSLTQPITATDITVNPRLVVEQTAQDRMAVFGDLLDEYLDAITAQTHVEAPDYLATTRRVLDLTLRIVRLEAQQPVDVAIEALEATHNGSTVLGSATAFNAVAGKGSNVSYTWEFGDGATGSGASPTHTYAAVGTYTVRVKASNSVSEVSVEMQVTITPTATDQVPEHLYLPAIRR